LNEYKSVDDAIVGCIEEIQLNGAASSPRGMETSEVTMLGFRLTDPRARIFTRRPIRLGYAAAKVAWDLGERHDVAALAHFNPNGTRFSDNGKDVQGENYGQRWSKYLPEAIGLLKTDPDTRRAWVPIWHGMDMINDTPPLVAPKRSNHHTGPHPSRYSTNVPCTIGFGLRIIDKQLVMQVVMRSNAVLGVLPYDIFLLTVIQELVANELGVALGPYEHVMLSAHLYAREADTADEALGAGPDDEGGRMPTIGMTLSDAQYMYPLALEKALEGGEQPAQSDPVLMILAEVASNG